MQETVQVSGTQEKIKQYGIKGELTYQESKKFTEMAISFEKMLFNNYRAAGSATTARSFGGLPQFITDNLTNCSSAALTEKNIMDTLQDVFDDVGLSNMPKTLVCNGWAKRKITSFYAPYAKMDRAERTGGVVVDTIDTEFGQLDLSLNTHCPSSKLYLLNLDKLGIGPLDGRAFARQELAKSGDYTRVQIIGEYTTKFTDDKCHALVYGFSTTS
jgi:hypothetical protein